MTDNPIIYRDYEIRPGFDHGFDYVHRDYAGLDDHRFGYATTVAGAMACIDEIIEEDEEEQP